MWKKLWSLHLPPKVKSFAWRACKDILPTKANLGKRKVEVDLLCDRCGMEPESTIHVLKSCHYFIYIVHFAYLLSILIGHHSPAAARKDLPLVVLTRLSLWVSRFFRMTRIATVF